MKEMGRYRIEQTLGSGGFGSVYKAHDTRLHRDVALKRLDKGQCEDSLREQLMKEARVLAAMQHPNIVSVYDVSSHEAFDEIVMELAVGVSFDRLVKRHLLLQYDFRHIARQVLNALSAAHKVGVLHCDLKPENIMLCMTNDDQYEVKMYDFGLSHPVSKEEASKSSKLMGSIYVMAPELFCGEQPSEQSDIYALGCLFYYLLTGAYPFYGDTSVLVMAMHISGNYAPLSEIRSDLSVEFCAWIDSLLAKDKSQRAVNCREALTQLNALVLPQQESEFTLSTDLELELKSSRVVRSISADSLALKDGENVEAPQTPLKNNHSTHSAPMKSQMSVGVGINKAAPVGLTKEAKANLPEGAEWYFSNGEVIKGPVTLDQLRNLCSTSTVEPNTLLWHPSYGEWIFAASCADTMGSFGTTKEPELDDLLQNVEWQDVKLAKVPVIGSEVLILILGALVVAGFLFFNPKFLPLIIAVYALVLFFVGFISSRLCQLRSGVLWFVFCLIVPVFGDVVHAIMKPSFRVVVCALMFIVGGLSFSLIYLGGEKSQIAERPTTDLDVKFLKSVVVFFSIDPVEK